MTNSRLLVFLLIVIVVLNGCHSRTHSPKLTEQEVATKWADLTLFVTRHTPGNSPTYASRAIGYIGVTMYESVVAGTDQSRSLAQQLNGLGEMPTPESNKEYHWALSLNAGQGEILRKLYNHTSDENKAKIDSLERMIRQSYADHLDAEIVARSTAYGKKVAEKIFEWSVSDGGHRGYLKNFDKDLVVPHKKGCWKPPLYGQSFSRYPLHPHWGDNRTFLKENASLPLPDFLPYSTSRQSAYYKQFLSVYQKEKELTQQEKETALWWGDDPADTFTPPGHSYNLGTITIKKLNPPLIKCAETYARIGIAVADSFINCWRLKYIFYSERPSTFITENIDEAWEQFWPDPPFPAFPSGHATQAASTAIVLAALYGENIEIMDDSHTGRTPDELRNTEFSSRSFTSFWQIAEETANSRFYGGIHTPQDNAVGLSQGKKIGDNVNALNWTHEHGNNFTAGNE